MGAELLSLKTHEWEALDQDDLLKRLNSHEGIIIENINEIEFMDDGTFEYKGQKVLVYIRDQKFNPQYGEREYKYHISNCDTIQEYIDNNRFNRYVVSTRTDGRFIINVKDSRSKEFIKQNEIVELSVCKNCLMRLSFNGYSSHRSDHKIYRDFSLQEFFQQYPSTGIVKPAHSDVTAPNDLYPPDFHIIADKIKKECNYTCDNPDCMIHVSWRDKRFIHIHHINGVKSDCHPSNLMCLCIKCHAEHHDHAHLKETPDYKDFMQKYVNRARY